MALVAGVMSWQDQWQSWQMVARYHGIATAAVAMEAVHYTVLLSPVVLYSGTHTRMVTERS